MFKSNFLLVIIVLFSFCKENFNKNQKLEVWEKIQDAVEQSDINYLLSISSDSLQCIECNGEDELVAKEVFFSNNIDQMNIGLGENYGYFIENIEDLNIGFKERIRISYRMKYKGNKYDVIYTILKNNEKVEFLGVISVP